MTTQATYLKYTGDHFPDLTGQLVTASVFAARLDKSARVVSAELHRAGSFKRGEVDDVDLLLRPAPKVIDSHAMAMKLTTMKWG
jgi:hypothetical protein